METKYRLWYCKLLYFTKHAYHVFITISMINYDNAEWLLIRTSCFYQCFWFRAATDYWEIIPNCRINAKHCVIKRLCFLSMPKVIVETEKPANKFIICMILILRYISSKTHWRHISDRYGTDAKNYASRRFSYCFSTFYWFILQTQFEMFLHL